jgi:hypothetical protein
VTQLNEQAATYVVVCDIQSKIDQQGGLPGVVNNPAQLAALAKEIGATVEDLRYDIQASLDRIEVMVNCTMENGLISKEILEEVNKGVKALLDAAASASSLSPVPAARFTAELQDALALTSSLKIDYANVLGQGSFGTVYEGTYAGERVAVKMLTSAAALALTAQEMKELSQEVLMHSKVSKLPGVVRLFGANLGRSLGSGQPLCVVLELASGSLHDVLHQRDPAKDLGVDLSLTSKLSLALQICATMSFISDAGILHRDIKSSNVLIFLQSHGRVSAKLADFGLAKSREETGGSSFTKNQTPKGTPPYQAPELFKGIVSAFSIDIPVAFLFLIF